MTNCAELKERCARVSKFVTYPLCILLRFSDNWYGILSSYSDNKKRASLMLSIFEPGLSVPWLGDMRKLGPASELPTNPYQLNSNDNSEETPFPVPAPRQRSYRSSSSAVWIKSSGLQVCIGMSLGH